MLPLVARRTHPLTANQAQKYTHTKADALAKETIRMQISRKRETPLSQRDRETERLNSDTTN